MICIFTKNGCQETFDNLQIVKEHIENCCYALRDCPLGCGQKVSAKKLIRHITKYCTYRGENCYFCGLELNQIHLDVHLKSCARKPVVCHFCGLETFQKEISSHLETCFKKLKPCNLNNFGCNYIGEASMITQHEQDLNIHFPLVCQSLKELSQQSYGKLDDFKIQIGNFLENKQKGFFLNLKKEIDRLETKILNVTSNISKMEKGFEEDLQNFSQLNQKIYEQAADTIRKEKDENLKINKIFEKQLNDLISNFIKETQAIKIELNKVTDNLTKVTTFNNKYCEDKQTETTSPQLFLSLDQFLDLKNIDIKLLLGQDSWFPKISKEIFQDYLSKNFCKNSKNKLVTFLRLTQINYYNKFSEFKEEWKENIEGIPFQISCCGKYSNEEKLRIKFLFKEKDQNGNNPMIDFNYVVLALANTANQEVVAYCTSLLNKFPEALGCTFWLTKPCYDNYYLHYPETPFTYLFFI